MGDGVCVPAWNITYDMPTGSLSAPPDSHILIKEVAQGGFRNVMTKAIMESYNISRIATFNESAAMW
jgi:hypothetical protein